MSTVDSSGIAGVFRDRSQAEQAVDELKQAGFAEDTIQLTEYKRRGVFSPSLQASNRRIIVHVKAPGKEQEAVGILVQHGANNADIPAGTQLVHGVLVGTNIERADVIPGQSHEIGPSDDLFEEADTREGPHMPRLEDDAPTQSNWLTSHVKNSKVAVSFSQNILCRIGMHQGTWTTQGCPGCWQRRFCMFCGKPQNRVVHDWPGVIVQYFGEYFQDGSCETRITCLRCGITKSTGVRHEGRTSFGDGHCKRCGEDLDAGGD